MQSLLFALLLAVAEASWWSGKLQRRSNSLAKQIDADLEPRGYMPLPKFDNCAGKSIAKAGESTSCASHDVQCMCNSDAFMPALEASAGEMCGSGAESEMVGAIQAFCDRIGSLSYTTTEASTNRPVPWTTTTGTWTDSPGASGSGSVWSSGTVWSSAQTVSWQTVSPAATSTSSWRTLPTARKSSTAQPAWQTVSPTWQTVFSVTWNTAETSTSSQASPSFQSPQAQTYTQTTTVETTSSPSPVSTTTYEQQPQTTWETSTPTTAWTSTTEWSSAWSSPEWQTPSAPWQGQPTGPWEGPWQGHPNGPPQEGQGPWQGQQQGGQQWQGHQGGW